MTDTAKKSKNTEAYIVVAAVLAVLAYIFFRLNGSTAASSFNPTSAASAIPVSASGTGNAGSPSTIFNYTAPAVNNIINIPANSYPLITPLSAGTVNIDFSNAPTADGVETYIPLFGFLRYGPSYG